MNEKLKKIIKEVAKIAGWIVAIAEALLNNL